MLPHRWPCQQQSRGRMQTNLTQAMELGVFLSTWNDMTQNFWLLRSLTTFLKLLHFWNTFVSCEGASNKLQFQFEIVHLHGLVRHYKAFGAKICKKIPLHDEVSFLGSDCTCKCRVCRCISQHVACVIALPSYLTVACVWEASFA